MEVKQFLQKLNESKATNALNKQNFDIFHPTYYGIEFLDYIGKKPFILTVHDMIHELFPKDLSKDLEPEKKKKLIDALFQDGKQEKLYPFLFFYLPNPDPEMKSHQVLFSVPKKYIRKAVDRNKIKRRLREAYRKNKYLIKDKMHSAVPFLLAYVYISKSIFPFKEIEKQVLTSFALFKKSV